MLQTSAVQTLQIHLCEMNIGKANIKAKIGNTILAKTKNR